MTDRQRVLRGALVHAAGELGVGVVGEPVVGSVESSIGAAVVGRDGVTVWLRVARWRRRWVSSPVWTGNQRAAAALPEVPMPRVLARIEWDDESDGEYVLYAETMTFVPYAVCSADPVLRSVPEVSEMWWKQLAASLACVADAPVEASAFDPTRFARRLWIRFGPGVDPAARVSSGNNHGDLHWANLTAPELMILDWETFGESVTGYDAANLLCHSLLVPAVAARVHETFADVLDSPTGRLAQLAAVESLLGIAGHNDMYVDLVEPLHHHARRLLD